MNRLKKFAKFIKNHKEETIVVAYSAGCVIAGAALSKDYYKSKATSDISGIKRIAVVREMQAYQKGLKDGVELVKLTTIRKK